jgi:hypothetical protein
MTDAYTVWCYRGRVGTYRTREQAEAVIEDIAKHPEKYLHVQKWTPSDAQYQFVTFEDESEE